MYTRDKLHDNLKYYRKKKGLSQTEVADRLGISRQAISNWESQRAYPDLDNIVLLCELYEITTDDLLGNKTNKTNTSIQAKETSDMPSEQKILDQKPQTVLEIICLSAILLLTCHLYLLGMLISIGVAIWLKKTGRKYIIIYLLCIVCLLISLQNTYTIIEHAFDLGTPHIEYLG